MISHNAMVPSRHLTKARKANPKYLDMQTRDSLASKLQLANQRAPPSKVREFRIARDEQIEAQLDRLDELQEQYEDDDSDYEPSTKVAKRTDDAMVP